MTSYWNNVHCLRSVYAGHCKFLMEDPPTPGFIFVDSTRAMHFEYQYQMWCLIRYNMRERSPSTNWPLSDVDCLLSPYSIVPTHGGRLFCLYFFSLYFSVYHFLIMQYQFDKWIIQYTIWILHARIISIYEICSGCNDQGSKKGAYT